VGAPRQNLSWSPDGQRLLVSTPYGPRVVARDGTGYRPLVDPGVLDSIPPQPDAAAYSGTGVVWSPDGSHVAFSSIHGVIVTAPDGSNLVRIEALPAESIDWSPDGTQLALTYVQGIARNVGYVPQAEITNLAGQRRQIQAHGLGVDWSPGKAILAEDVPSGSGPDFHTVLVNPNDGTSKDVSNLAIGGTWSPDGSVFAGVTTDDSGSSLVLYNADGALARTIVRYTTASGTAISRTSLLGGGWSPDGSHILLGVRKNGSYSLDSIDVSSGSSQTVWPAATAASWLPA
jgi:Tol biopolymer transport system component